MRGHGTRFQHRTPCSTAHSRLPGHPAYNSSVFMPPRRTEAATAVPRRSTPNALASRAMAMPPRGTEAATSIPCRATKLAMVFVFPVFVFSRRAEGTAAVTRRSAISALCCHVSSFRGSCLICFLRRDRHASASNGKRGLHGLLLLPTLHGIFPIFPSALSPHTLFNAAPTVSSVIFLPHFAAFRQLARHRACEQSGDKATCSARSSFP